MQTCFFFNVPTLFQPFYRSWLTRRRVCACSKSEVRRDVWKISLSTGSSPEVILALDVGSSGSKAGLISIESGLLLSSAFEAHETQFIGNSHVTQNTADWINSSISSARRAFESYNGTVSTTAVAVTGSMQNLSLAHRYDATANRSSLLSSNCSALDGGTAIMYSDARASEAAERLTRDLRMSVQPTSLLAKLAYLHNESNFGNARAQKDKFVLGAADAVIYGLGGDLVTDPTNASTTGLTKAPHRAYDEQLLLRAGLGDYITLLPRISNESVCGVVGRRIANDMEMPFLAGVPLIHAGGDAASATFAAGCIAPECGRYIYFGTTGWVGGSVYGDGSANEQSQRRANGVFYLGHITRPDCSIELGSVSSAGGCLTWAAKELFGGISVRSLLDMGQQASIGSRGVVFIPWLAGRRCPFPDVLATGGIIGVSSSTRMCDIARACIEGVAFAYKACYEQIRDNDDTKQIQLPDLSFIGGGARSHFVAEVLAGALQCNIMMQSAQHAGVTGAALFTIQSMYGSLPMSENRDAIRNVFTRPVSSEREEYEIAWNRWRSFAWKF